MRQEESDERDSSMMGLLTLLAIALLLAIAIAAGAYAYRGSHKWWAFVLVTVIVLWLPFWDVVPGVILFNKKVRELGGVRVFRKVEVDGFLDRTCYSECYDRWRALLSTRRDYRYIEAEVATRRGLADPLNLQPGYYTFHLEQIDESACEALRKADVSTQALRGKAEGKCVVAERHDDPVSRYVFEDSNGWQPLPGSSRNVPILGFWHRVIDRETGEILGQSYRLMFVSWIGRHGIGIPRWRYVPDGNVVLEPSDVLMVQSSQSKGRN